MRRRNIMPIQLIALILLFALVVIGLVLSYSMYDKTNRHEMQIRKVANDLNAVYNVVGNLEQFIQHLPPAMGGFAPSSAPVQGVPQPDVYQDELLPEDPGYEADDGVDEYVFDADACCPDGQCPGGMCEFPCSEEDIDRLVEELAAAEAGAEPEAEPEAEASPESGAEPEAKPDPESKSEAPEAELEAESEAEPTAPESETPDDGFEIKRVVIDADKSEKKKRTPNDSPSGFDIGYQMESENDGHQYQVVENKNGKKRWKKID